MTQPEDRQPTLDPIPPDTSLPVRPLAQRMVAVLLIVLLLGGGVAGTILLVKSKPKAKKRQPQRIERPVQTLLLERTDYIPIITALGTVIPSQELALKPEVSGTVIELNPNLIPGGVLQQGEQVLAIDDRDYALTLEKSRLAMEKASMDLRLEKGNQTVARREYELIQRYAGATAAQSSADLALRKPQLAKAKAAEAEATIAWQQARLDLERTRIAAPFNALVLSKEATLGTQVSTQTTVATLVGTDCYWVRLSLPQSLLDRLDLDNAKVEIRGSGTPYSAPWPGRVLRLQGDVDVRGLMARLLVQIDQPLAAGPGRSPLLLGSAVKASITGKPLIDCFRLPINALRVDQTVLIANPDQTLDIRPVQTLWQNQEWVYLREGLRTGERLIISELSAPIQGMSIRIDGAEPPADSGEANHGGRRVQ